MLPNTALAVLRGRLVLCFEAVMIVGVTTEKWEWRDGFSHGQVRRATDDTTFFGFPPSSELSAWQDWFSGRLHPKSKGADRLGVGMSLLVRVPAVSPVACTRSRVLASSTPAMVMRPLPHLWVQPPRQQRPLPGMRNAHPNLSGIETCLVAPDATSNVLGILPSVRREVGCDVTHPMPAPPVSSGAAQRVWHCWPDATHAYAATANDWQRTRAPA